MNKPKAPAGSLDYVKSLAWLIEAGFRGLVAYIVLMHMKHTYLNVTIAIYALVTAALIVLYHFAKAHK